MAKLSQNEIDIRVTLRSPSGETQVYEIEGILCIPEGMSLVVARGIVEDAGSQFRREIWHRMRISPEGTGMEPYDFNGIVGGQQAAVDSVTPSYSAERG